MNKSGYIYFASNPVMFGLIKIGQTKDSPKDRLPELYSTAVPTPFVLEACFRVNDRIEAEKRIHELLTQSRHTSNREFFQISLQDALERCLPHLKEFLTSKTATPENVPNWRLSTDEERVLWLIAQRMNKPNQPNRNEVQRELKLSNIKAELIFGNLVKRRFMRDGKEKRSHQTGDFSYEYYNVKVLQLERAGIQYLLDNGLIAPEKL